MIVEWMLAMTLKDIAWLAGQRQMSSPARCVEVWTAGRCGAAIE